MCLIPTIIDFHCLSPAWPRRGIPFRWSSTALSKSCVLNYVDINEWSNSSLNKPNSKGYCVIFLAKGIDSKVEELIKAVADSGAKVVVSGAAVGEMALHFCERYKIFFVLRRFCRTTGAVALLKLSPPNPDNLGYADSVSVEEIGGARVTIVKNDEAGNSVTTVVLRGSTDSILDDLERAVDDGVNTYKDTVNKGDGIICDIIGWLVEQLEGFSFKSPPESCFELDVHFETISTEHQCVSELLWRTFADDFSLLNRFFALKYATDAACTVLRVDQIIMSKPAGGPKRDQPAGMDED
ncbi:hypothetical protein KSP40_PGU012410 [Platanthera guangdongensis]|uniref:Uncharacterized protein n=1 Tax=Platanthera guangdongensis TaxID=2320717 RepID=A0ABR2LVD1_9ASPA